MTRLELAIDNLYEVFSVYAVPKLPPFGTIWIPELPETINALIGVPLREIGFHEIQNYVVEAYTSFGDTRDFRYFLPRVFEVLCSEEHRWLDYHRFFMALEAQFGMTGAPLSQWSELEQAAVLEFSLAWFERVFCEEYVFPYTTTTILGNGDRISNVVENTIENRIQYHRQWQGDLLILAEAYNDLTPFLEAWLNSQNRDANCNFAGFVMAFFAEQKIKTANPNTDTEVTSFDIFLETWLLQPLVLERLRQMQQRLSNDPEVDIFSEAISYLECARSPSL